MELKLKTSVQYVLRVGPTMAKRLAKLRIFTVEDLLFHVPFRYNDYSLVSNISAVQPGEVVTIQGNVRSIKNIMTKRGKRIQEARVVDATGELTVIWFNQPYLTNVIRVGDTIHLSGPIKWFGHSLVMESPEYELTHLPASRLGTDAERKNSAQLRGSIHTGRLVPVYPETEGVSSKWLRARIAFILDNCIDQVLEYLPGSIISKYQLMSAKQALEYIHYPPSLPDASSARYRLGFEEVFLLQLRGLRERYISESTQKSAKISIAQNDIASFTGTLPFRLTDDQKKAISDIFIDFQKPTPMNRLLEGDVGSGKTIVSAIAMYALCRNGLRSVLMAPTQILAEQHYRTISSLLAPFGIHVTLITGSRPLPHNSKFVIHNSNIIIGTHALLSDTLAIPNVGLVVIDEQQRFGVNQRRILREKSQGRVTPHLLIMTATPIPRTIARTMFGYLDLSVLRQMPEGRQKIKTWVVPKHKRGSAYEWIRKELKKTNAQAFVVCPFIEESESLQTVRAATIEYQRLKKEVFPELSLGLLHGRISSREKQKVLEDFRNNTRTILVTTPVVEVGIDVPNATIMLIEAADRFGLAQLHQLRGRVGRGSLQSYCLLFTETEDDKTMKRLKALETTHNGPELAELDLTLRGPGELFGTRQHGIPELKIASFSDTKLIAQSYQAARELMATDPSLERFSLLRAKLNESTIESVSQD